MRQIERITAASAVGDADVEQAEIRVTGRSKWVESDLTAVVVTEGLLEAEQFARSAAGVGRDKRFGSPRELLKATEQGA